MMGWLGFKRPRTNPESSGLLLIRLQKVDGEFRILLAFQFRLQSAGLLSGENLFRAYQLDTPTASPRRLVV